jgi:hypothetical protein
VEGWQSHKFGQKRAPNDPHTGPILEQQRTVWQAGNRSGLLQWMLAYDRAQVHGGITAPPVQARKRRRAGQGRAACRLPRGSPPQPTPF